MNIQFFGAAQTVTGSFFLISTETSKVVVDCGLFQGSKALKERNYGEFAVPPQSVDYLIVTHAHVDHIGLIPKFCKQGFNGKIYCSQATLELAAILLPDSAYIQEMEVERKNRKRTRAGSPPIQPIYTVEDANRCMHQFQAVDIDEIIKITPDIEMRLQDAGHILGACCVELWITERGKKTKLVFSGDLGYKGQPIIRDPAVIKNADYVIIESTYGNRFHEMTTDRREELRKVVIEAMERGGNLVIPAFAVARTQDLLYDLLSLQRQGKLPPGLEIYIDSPLAIAATEIFIRFSELFDDDARVLLGSPQDFFKSLNIKFSRTMEESIQLNRSKGKKIIISASGMCDAGRIKFHLKHNLWREESTVLFVGYQAEGTLGRRILEGEKLVTIHGEQVAVKAAIYNMSYYSAHADRQGLLDWLQQFDPKPQGVFIVHGEIEAQKAFADYIRQELGMVVYIPAFNDQYELEAGLETATAPSEVPLSVENILRAEEQYLQLRLDLNHHYQKLMQQGDWERMQQLSSEMAALLRQEQELF